MNKNVARVLNGIMKLNPDEKEEFLEQLGEFEKYPTLTKKGVEESLQKSVVTNESYSVSLGPTPTGCPCCGK